MLVLIILQKITAINSLSLSFEQELKSSYSNEYVFCSKTCLEKMKKSNCQKISHCFCFTINRRSY